MEKKRILYISQEISPYTGETTMGEVTSMLSQKTQEGGADIRIFLPRFGTINERRHQLHEVIRLSGMNLIIDDFDHQLIIKVASIQKLRLQVYFIDNEEYFPSKQVFNNLDGEFMSNNDERMIFYCKGVIETVRKLGWAPDIIHCQGWFTSLVPMYIRKLYAEEPLFDNVKVVYSIFNNGFDGVLGKGLSDKLLYEKLEDSDVSRIKKSNITNLHKFAIDYADAIVESSPEINNDIISHIQLTGKPFMKYPGKENYIEACQHFYDQLLDIDHESGQFAEEPEEVSLI